jgi:hypothetical protein
MEVVLVLAVAVVAVLVIAAPLWPGSGRAPGAAADESESAERAELEAAKEAKLREIREAELDYRTGKLSRSDWRELDADLRAQAISLLRELDRLDNSSAQGHAPIRDGEEMEK